MAPVSRSGLSPSHEASGHRRARPYTGAALPAEGAGGCAVGSVSDMRIVVAGGHGQIALLFARQAAQRGDQTIGLIRNPGHGPDVAAAGATPVVADLEGVS